MILFVAGGLVEDGDIVILVPQDMQSLVRIYFGLRAGPFQDGMKITMGLPGHLGGLDSIIRFPHFAGREGRDEQQRNQ